MVDDWAKYHWNLRVLGLGDCDFGEGVISLRLGSCELGAAGWGTLYQLFV